MGHHNTAFGKFQKFRQDIFDHFGILNHAVMNTCQFFDFKRNRPFRIDKGTIPIHNLTFFDLYRTNFDDTVIDRTEPCRLNIKDNKPTVQALIFRIKNDRFQVVHKIALNPINRLKICSFNTMIRIRKGLDNAMIRNRHRRMSPGHGCFQHLFTVCHTIHITHGRMGMKLYPFDRTVIHSFFSEIRNIFYTYNRIQGDTMVKLIHNRHSFQADKFILFQI